MTHAELVEGAQPGVAAAVPRALPDPKTEPTIDVPRAAQILGISRNSCYAAVQRGELPSIRLLGRVLIPSAALLKLLEGGA